MTKTGMMSADLRSALGDPEAQLDLTALLALTGAERDEAERLLIGALEGHDARTAEPLAKLGGPAGRAALQAYAVGGGEEKTRLFVLHALWTTTQDRQWVEPMLFLLGNPDENVRRIATVLASDAPKELALPRLRHAMLDDESTAVRAIALSSILALHGFADVAREPGSLLGSLFTCIGTPLRGVRVQAAEQLDEVLTLSTEVVAACEIDLNVEWVRTWFIALRDGKPYPEDALLARQGFERLWLTNSLMSMVHTDARAVRLLQHLAFDGLVQICAEALQLDVPADVRQALSEIEPLATF
jgi:hypothetical protein